MLKVHTTIEMLSPKKTKWEAGCAHKFIPYPGWRIRFEGGCAIHEKIPGKWEKVKQCLYGAWRRLRRRAA